MKGKVSEEQAMGELVDVIKSLKPDGFEPKIIKQDKDYLYVEYSSPTFGVSDNMSCRGLELDALLRNWCAPCLLCVSASSWSLWHLTHLKRHTSIAHAVH